MSSFQWKRVGLLVLVLVLGGALLLPNLPAAQSQQPAAQGGQSDPVSITYVPPDNSSFQEVYDLLRQHDALEKIKRYSLRSNSPSSWPSKRLNAAR